MKAHFFFLTTKCKNCEKSGTSHNKAIHRVLDFKVGGPVRPSYVGLGFSTERPASQETPQRQPVEGGWVEDEVQTKSDKQMGEVGEQEPSAD